MQESDTQAISAEAKYAQLATAVGDKVLAIRLAQSDIETILKEMEKLRLEHLATLAEQEVKKVVQPKRKKAASV